MKNKFLKGLVASFALGVSGFANAGLITYEGASDNVNNCIPFGCPDRFGPHMGFVYKDIEAFTLNIGDTIAFDLGRLNDNELSFDLSLAATTTNGGDTADGAGFTLVSSLGSGFYGDTVIGNYDLIFTAASAFSFDGGGLIVNFLNTNGVISDATTDQNLVYSTDNPYTVRRYFSGNSVGDMSNSNLSDGRRAVGNMQINTVNVPEPSTLAIFALGLMGLASRRFKK